MDSAATLALVLADGEDARRIPEYSQYFVTSHGRVFSTKYGKVRELRLDLGRNGAVRVTLSDDNVADRHVVARLIARVFLGPRNAGHVVIHLNGDSADNRLLNLAYGTRSDLGRIATAIPTVMHGEDQHLAKLDRKKVARIRRLLEAGETHASIARRFGVSRPAIGLVASGVTWRRV